ncbi:type VI secretion system tube protein Hcp, partial [Escherichia coli]|nr:type VI secretion system tube protein Hcp [Escherichia coli]
EEVIVLNYKNITWKYHIASTESYSCWEEMVF